uniref:Uncharacterized protein n=1 Tax=Arundo donax TaxID=35708 RepID=A0A0A9AD80_ARUDO
MLMRTAKINSMLCLSSLPLSHWK